MSRSQIPSSFIHPASTAPLSRREFLGSAAGGMTGAAVAWLMGRGRAGGAMLSKGGHGFARARRVVQIFCCGGVSHLDSFDHKPELARWDGKTLEGKGENIGFFGQPGKVMKSPYEFRQHGRSGAWVSSLLPNLAGCVDDLCFIHSMNVRSNNHTPATFQMNSGFTLNGFPSMGAWLSYALGSENENLPTFVVLPDPRGWMAGGSINWTSGFLPASHQGVPFRTLGQNPVMDLETPASIPAEHRDRDMRLLAGMNRRFAEQHPGDAAFAERLRSYELAARMQVSIPEASGIDSEPGYIRDLYGIDDPRTKGFSRSCLMARRLLERGVRFVQIINGGAFGSPRINWDGHENLKENHDTQAATMDRPTAGLIHDLKQRGMLEDTLVVWCTEFGRSPSTQGIGASGRDHHPLAFTSFLAGAGVKPGFRYGESDEVGYFASKDP
ncbi:MAG: DUF1501 domain-containing protein, partial [Verrucomicrobia bacterium]|nr:DUF1501 domain-containing protein [Verrucomicrobiota bacterium]